MERIDHLEKIVAPYKNAAVTIGNFDGVHVGHQTLFRKVIEKAAALAGTSIAMTFEPHPLQVLQPNRLLPLITLYEQKVELIERSGMDVLICIPFTREFASITAREFVEDILVRRIGMKAIVVGEDYTFGKHREGNLDLLKTFAERLDFEVVAVDWMPESDSRLGRASSTRIREFIAAGKVQDARKLLGRHYQIRGKVISGRDRGGRLLGFPTANISLQDGLCPKTGVYAVLAECLGETYNGVANIGYSPTFGDNTFTIEVHLLDFDDDIYGEKIRVNFIKRIRGEIKFPSVSELSDQIKSDIQKARTILAADGSQKKVTSDE